MQVQVCSGVGDVELVFVPPGAVVSGLQQIYLQQGWHRQAHSWVCTSCRLLYIVQTLYDVLMEYGLQVTGAEPPGLRHFRWGWSHEGCGRLTVIVPSPVWTWDVADGGPTPLMHTLVLDTQGFCSNVSGQHIPSGSYIMQWRSLCWLSQQLTGCVPPSGGFLSTLLQGTLHWQLFQGFGCGDVAGGDPVPFLGHSQFVTFLYVKGHQPPPLPGLQWSEVIL